MNPKTKSIFIGISAANLLGLGFILLGWWLSRVTGDPKGGEKDTTLFFVASDFVLIPLMMGALTAYLWHPFELSRGEAAGYSFLNLFVGCLLCALVLREGTICLLMALPLLLLFQTIGYALGRALANRKSRPLNASLAPLFLLALIANVLTTRGFDGQVTDKIVIHASPKKVWRYIAEYPAITDPPDYWLWKIGLPAPMQSTATGDTVGSQRKCLFTGNLVVEERITQATPEKELTFDVTAQPKDPEISGHFALRKGQFVLTDNGDGTTTVTGTSWYTLNVHPACYYDLWVRDIARHVHLRVMRRIKTLSESAP